MIDKIKCKCGCGNYLFIIDSEYTKHHKVIGIGKHDVNPESLEGFLVPNQFIKELRRMLEVSP